MSSTIIAENRISVSRVGHHYYHDLTRNGNVIALNAPVSRDRALEIVTNNNGGTIPAECNFDVCHPRSWRWTVRP